MAESSAVMHVIARIHTDFPEKFGVPRQSGLVDELAVMESRKFKK